MQRNDYVWFLKGWQNILKEWAKFLKQIRWDENKTIFPPIRKWLATNYSRMNGLWNDRTEVKVAVSTFGLYTGNSEVESWPRHKAAMTVAFPQCPQYLQEKYDGIIKQAMTVSLSLTVRIIYGWAIIKVKASQNP
jgi:hypothetical protein